MKTIARHLKVSKFPFHIHDEFENLVYMEREDGIWFSYEFDERRNLLYSEDSTGFFIKYEYDQYNNKIYYETSHRGIIFDHRNQ